MRITVNPPVVGEAKNLGPFMRRVTPPRPRKPAPPKQKLGTPGNPYRIPDLPPGVTAPGAPQDPFAATPAGALQSQAAQQIHAIYDPIIKQLQDAAQNTITTGSNAITGYTSALADRLGGYAPATRQANTAAQQSLAALEAAAGQQLRGEGSSLAGDLGKQLAQINAPNASAVTSNLTDTANNAAASDYASNNAQLQSLVEQGQHAADYVNKLPGIASLTGLQNIRDLTQSTNNQLAQQLGQTSAQIPSAIQSLLGQLQANEVTEAGNRQQQQQFAASQAASARQNAATLKEQQREFNLTAKANGIKIANDLNIAKVKAKTSAEAAAAKAAQNNINNRLKFAKTYGYDPVTGQTIAGYKRQADGTVAKVATPKTSKASTLTANEIANDVQAWHDGKPTSVKVPATDKDGNPVYNPTTGAQVFTTKTATSGALSYTQALRRLVALNGGDRQAALAALDSAWKRGEGGRAWLKNSEQAVLRQAKLPPRVRKINGHGVLTAAQVAALRKAGQLPPGQATSDGFYVIAQTY